MYKNTVGFWVRFDNHKSTHLENVEKTNLAQI